MPGTVRPRGRKVHLRRPARRDRTEFMALWRDSEAFLRPWSPRPPRGRPWDDPLRFREYLQAAADPRRRRFLVCRNSDGAMVGAVTLGAIEGGVFQNARAGWWVGAAHARKGYTTEAVRLLVRYAFRTLGLHRVEASIRPDNEPSLRLARRVGMRKEGYSPRLVKIDGVWRDHERWAILRDP